MEKHNKELYEKWLKDKNTKIPPMTNTQSRFAKFLRTYPFKYRNIK